MGDGPPGFRRGFSCPAVLGVCLKRKDRFAYAALTLFGRLFQTCSTTFLLCNSFVRHPATPIPVSIGLGFSPFARHYLGNRFCFLLLRVLRCFSSPGCLLISYVFKDGYASITKHGFPHSEIPGSLLTYSSPRHFGVRPVLLRLLAPRHPPCALSILTFFPNTLFR